MITRHKILEIRHHLILLFTYTIIVSSFSMYNLCMKRKKKKQYNLPPLLHANNLLSVFAKAFSSSSLSNSHPQPFIDITLSFTNEFSHRRPFTVDLSLCSRAATNRRSLSHRVLVQPLIYVI